MFYQKMTDIYNYCYKKTIHFNSKKRSLETKPKEIPRLSLWL